MFAANVGLLLAPWDMTLFRMGSPFYLLAVTRSPTQRMFTACFTAMAVKKKTLLSFLLYNYFGYGYMKPVILICNGIQNVVPGLSMALKEIKFWAPSTHTINLAHVRQQTLLCCGKLTLKFNS